MILFATQEPIDWKKAQKRTPSADQKPQSYSPLSLGSALQLFHRKNALFVDVREKRHYDYGHIEGAVHFSPEALANPSPEVMASLREKASVVLYCNGSGCGSVYAVARRLADSGVERLFVYSEGWPEWKSARLPMTMSDAMKKDIEQEWNPPQTPEEEL